MKIFKDQIAQATTTVLDVAYRIWLPFSILNQYIADDLWSLLSTLWFIGTSNV